MAICRTLFSSASAEWETPQALFDELNEEFHFTLDVCASEDKAKCQRYSLGQPTTVVNPGGRTTFGEAEKASQ